MQHLEPTRTRKHGTRVTKTKDGDEIIAACRSIIANSQYAKINGHIYDAVNEANRAKLKALPIARIASIAFKMLG